MVVNVDWFFLSHRLPVALGALRAGHEVHVATSLTQGREKLESYGFIVHPIAVDRSAAGPIELLRLFFSLLTIFWQVRPDVLHLVTIKPILIGGVAARLSPVRGVVYAVSGLGHVFVADGWLGHLRRKLVGAWYRFVLGAQNMRIIFQNPDDRREIESLVPLDPAQVVMIPGSGVDLGLYRPAPVPTGVPVVLMASRLLATKGTREYVAAAQLLRAQGVRAKFLLVGDPDPDNPASIPAVELERWAEAGEVTLLGHQAEMASLMSCAHVVVLPSYREGLPKVLIEAAACGRAVVTTDVPGCREAIAPGVTGVLVPPKNARALADAIRSLLSDPKACETMGREGRRRAEQMFDVSVVVRTHLDIYQAVGRRD